MVQIEKYIDFYIKSRTSIPSGGVIVNIFFIGALQPQPPRISWPPAMMDFLHRSEGLTERDIWSLGVMVQGSGQMGELSARRRRRRRHLENWEIGNSRLSHSFEN